MTDQGAGRVILFGGHMVDLPDRPEPRFPPRAVDAAAEAIGRALDKLLAEGPEKAVAASSAARGGDLLFLEACRARGLVTHIVLPFAPERFLETSVRGAESGDWEGRFQAIWRQTPEAMRHVLDTREANNPYAACNRVLVDLALRLGGKLCLIVLWNGRGGDGPGGTANLVEGVHKAGGEVVRIDSEALLRSMNGDAGGKPDGRLRSTCSAAPCVSWRMPLINCSCSICSLRAANRHATVGNRHDRTGCAR